MEVEDLKESNNDFREKSKKIEKPIKRIFNRLKAGINYQISLIDEG
jgi:hypothetical protein